MARPRLFTTEAIVLRAQPTGEADRLLTLFTPFYGKLRAVARGVRRPTSRLAGHVEPLVRTSLSLAQGRSLATVSQGEVLEPFSYLREDLHRFSQATYVADLVERFTPDEQPHRALYELFLGALRWLAEAPPLHLFLRHFELRLLDLVGYRPELYRCAECGAPLELRGYLFSALAGGTVCIGCAPRVAGGLHPLSVSGLKALRYLQEKGSPQVVRLRLSSDLGEELARVTRAYISHLLEGEVKSAVFLRQVSRGESPPTPAR